MPFDIGGCRIRVICAVCVEVLLIIAGLVMKESDKSSVSFPSDSGMNDEADVL